MPRKSTTRNAQGSGSIRQRKDGTWEARYTVGRNPGTGKQVQRSVYGKTQAEVRKRLQQISVSLDEGDYISPSKMTVGQWLDTWYSTYLPDVKPFTVASYRVQINNHLKPEIGAVKLSALNAPQIQALYNKLLRSKENPKGLSPKSIKNVHGVLHSALKQAQRLGYIRSNPADAIILPRIEKHEVSFLHDEDIPLLLETIKGHRYENIYRVDIFTGMREGEILGLRWDDINFKTGTITIRQQLQREKKKGGVYYLASLKNDRIRKIKPSAYVMEILQHERQKQRENRLRAGAAWENEWNLVFTDELGNHFCGGTVYNNLRRITAGMGLPNTRFHDLRHSFAVLSLQNGDSVRTVQAALGHATASFTLDCYGHVSEQMMQESADRMQRYIEGLKTAR